MSPSSSRGTALPDRTCVLVLVSAPWAGPSRPAPTVLRELARRWGDARPTVLVEDPDERTLDAWAIEVLPTWLLLEEAAGADDDVETDALEASGPTGVTAAGDRVTLHGRWRQVRRLTGARPKHVIDAEFGPGL